MNLQENIRKILREETKHGKYLPMIKDLTEDFKNEDCVCDIEIEYRPDRYVDAYIITVVLGTIDLDDKFNGTPSSIREYKHTLKRKITREVIDYLPISFFVEFKSTPKCYKDLQESEDKKSRLLSSIEQDGLYQVMKYARLSLQQIISKTGKLSREVYEKFIRDCINEEGYHQPNGTVQLGYAVEIKKNIQIDGFYMSGDKVTVEIIGYDNYERQTEGYIESLSNLSDEEISVIVNDLILWVIE